MAYKTPPEFEVKIEKLVYGGEGLGYYDNRPIFVYGVLPKEKVLVSPIKIRGKYIKAKLVKVIEVSPDRREPKDSHYLTSSPWEIMSEYAQMKYKQETLISMWEKLAGGLPTKKVRLEPSPQNWGYRNKMEYSFTDINGPLELCFHERFRHNRFLPLKTSALAPATMNDCAQYIIKELNKKKISNSSLKNLLIRYSFSQNKCLAVLLVKDKNFPVFSLEDENLTGWQIVYSNPKSPAAVFTTNLLTEGEMVLEEKLGKYSFAYGAENFFQVNPPAFEKLLVWLETTIKKSDSLLDLYAGVGTIGFCLSKLFKEIISVESDLLGNEFAKANAEHNKIKNVRIIGGQVEKQDLFKLLAAVDTLIVDPPRSGLHPKVLAKIIASPPQQFIYVSCNAATQARDWKELRKIYKTTAWQLFDLYPQTPHVESVLIMNRK